MRPRSIPAVALMLFATVSHDTSIVVESSTVSLSPMIRTSHASNERQLFWERDDRSQLQYDNNNENKNNRIQWSKAIRVIVTQSLPALRHTKNLPRKSYEMSDSNDLDLIKTVSVRTRGKTRILDIVDFKKPFYYYGIDPDTMIPKRNHERIRPAKPPKLKDTMIEALEELKLLRQEMERMRMGMEQMRREMLGEEDDVTSEYSIKEAEKIQRKKQKVAEKLAEEIELWGNNMLQEGEEEGWKQLECNKLIRASVNGMERTTAYMKWIPDSRGDKADKEDYGIYPCIKCYSTIDAPLEEVCLYLSQPDNSVEYNDVVEKHEDLEEISSSAKICWSQSPQILFVKPRNFVTFCHHRWKSDGTEIIVNQACEHPKYPLEEISGKKEKSCRGYALRGINSKLLEMAKLLLQRYSLFLFSSLSHTHTTGDILFFLFFQLKLANCSVLSKCPEDPSKTKIAIVTHANPGGGLPDWATKTAVNALAPIEPFKLFHKINEKVVHCQPHLRKQIIDEEKSGTSSRNVTSGKSHRPGGISQLGYACFWPDGGGKIETGIDKNLEPCDAPILDEARNDSILPITQEASVV